MLLNYGMVLVRGTQSAILLQLPRGAPFDGFLLLPRLATTMPSSVTTVRTWNVLLSMRWTISCYQTLTKVCLAACYREKV